MRTIGRQDQPVRYGLIRPLPIQESIDRADLGIVILVGLHFVIAVKILDIGDRIIQFQITADVSRHSFKLVVRVGSIDVK